MSIADEVRAAAQPKLCKFADILTKLDDTDRAEITGALASDALTSSAVARILTRNSHPVGEKAVRHHVKKICGCGDPA